MISDSERRDPEELLLRAKELEDYFRMLHQRVHAYDAKQLPPSIVCSANAALELITQNVLTMPPRGLNELLDYLDTREKERSDGAEG